MTRSLLGLNVKLLRNLRTTYAIWGCKVRGKVASRRNTYQMAHSLTPFYALTQPWTTMQSWLVIRVAPWDIRFETFQFRHEFSSLGFELSEECCDWLWIWQGWVPPRPCRRSHRCGLLRLRGIMRHVPFFALLARFAFVCYRLHVHVRSQDPITCLYKVSTFTLLSPCLSTPPSLRPRKPLLPSSAIVSNVRLLELLTFRASASKKPCKRRTPVSKKKASCDWSLSIRGRGKRRPPG